MLRSTLTRCTRGPLASPALLPRARSTSSLSRRRSPSAAGHPHPFPVLPSLVDTSAPTFEERAAQMAQKEDELRAMWGKVCLGGGERARAKAKQAGKLLVRERCVLVSLSLSLREASAEVQRRAQHRQAPRPLLALPRAVGPRGRRHVRRQGPRRRYGDGHRQGQWVRRLAQTSAEAAKLTVRASAPAALSA